MSESIASMDLPGKRTTHQPASQEELVDALGDCAQAGRPIRIGGGFTKDWLGGPLNDAGSRISTGRMTRILRYEPRDLTLSVEAGIRYADLSRALAEQGQMLPLDPPFAHNATIGGILASGWGGPRRRLYGTARDLLIGMRFATLQGRLVQSGGMVVKNVAGLDMGKLMIGSLGTLAGIAVANFKVVPIPPERCTCFLQFATAAELFAARDRVLRGVLQPAAVELLNPAATQQIAAQANEPPGIESSGIAGLGGYLLALYFGGTPAVIQRSKKECSEYGSLTVLEGDGHARFWSALCEFTPIFLDRHPQGASVRISSAIEAMKEVFPLSPGPVVARGGNGVFYAHFASAAEAEAWTKMYSSIACVIEYASPEFKRKLQLWPRPGNDLAMMRKVKNMFDPAGLLNAGRLYGIL